MHTSPRVWHVPMQPARYVAQEGFNFEKLIMQRESPEASFTIFTQLTSTDTFLLKNTCQKSEVKVCENLELVPGQCVHPISTGRLRLPVPS